MATTLTDHRELFRLSTVHRCLHNNAARYMCSKFQTNSSLGYSHTRGYNNIHLEKPNIQYYRKSFEFHSLVIILTKYFLQCACMYLQCQNQSSKFKVHSFCNSPNTEQTEIQQQKQCTQDITGSSPCEMLSVPRLEAWPCAFPASLNMK